MPSLRTSGSGPAVLVPGTDSSGAATSLAVPAFTSVDMNGNVPGPVNAFASGNQPNGIASAIMPAVAGKTNYVTGITITSAGATAPSVVLAQLGGILGQALVLAYPVTTGSLVANPTLSLTFSPPLQGTGPNTQVTATLPALGVGNLYASVMLYGYTA